MQHVQADSSTHVRVTLQPAQFDVVRDLLATYGGVYLDRTSQRVLTLGVCQRMAATGLTLERYIARLAQPAGRSELHQLAELILNHETIFFRNLPHMNALQQVILPQLHQQKPAQAALRIWSAGCSTGEEPYSLAITALETLGHSSARPLAVWATDLSETALAKARRGIYRGRALTNVKPDVYRTYFEYRREGWSLREHVRSIVTFDQLNLLDPFPSKAQGVDIIFCQNVTIYFQLATFRNLVERFYAILPEGGMLFLGFSETLWNVFDKFRLREIAGAFVYVKEAAATAGAISFTPSSNAAGRPAEQPNRPPAPASRLSPRIEDKGPKPAPALAGQRPPAPFSPNGQQPVSSSTPSHTVHTMDTDILQRGQELLAAGKVEEVLTMCYQSPLDGAQAPQVLTLIARAHANRGDFDLAVAEARRAVELDPLIAEAYLLLGMLHAQQGQQQEAAQQFERARYLEPASALVSYHLAECYRQLQRREVALREYRNTLNKLAGHAPDAIVDGVAVDWLRETCKRHIKLLEPERR